jgi:hypothetical protein
MLRRVSPVRTDVSEELSTSFVRLTRIGEPGTKATLMKEALSSSEIPVLTRVLRRNIPEDATLEGFIVHRIAILRVLVRFPLPILIPLTAPHH